jgi:hypothetical protein
MLFIHYYNEAYKAVAAGKFRDIPISASVGKEQSPLGKAGFIKLSQMQWLLV